MEIYLIWCFINESGTLVGYATVKEVVRKDDGNFHKRPGNVVQYEIILDNETFTVTLRPNKKLFTSGKTFHLFHEINILGIHEKSYLKLKRIMETLKLSAT